MKHPTLLILALLSSICLSIPHIRLAAAGEAGDPGAVTVTGAVPKPVQWTAARLKDELAASMKPLAFESRGKKHTANAVPLLAVLHASGVPTELVMDPKADPSSKNYPLRLTILVRGADGYTAAFSLAELLADIGGREAWLAIDLDGQPLAPAEAPMRLIVPSDAKPGRWVRGVAGIAIVAPPPPATQPGSRS